VDFRDENGARRWESYKTRKEADDALARRVRELDTGTYRPAKEIPTFGEVADEWLRGKSDRRVSTYAAWQVHVDVHLKPGLGALRIDQVRVKEVARLRDGLRANLAPQTVNKLLTTATAIFTFANARDYTVRNPAALCDRCKLDAGEVSPAEEQGRGATLAVRSDEVLTPDEARRTLAKATPGFDRAYLMVAVLTGLRVGEQTGLTWRDVDLATGEVQVRRSVSWAKI
jgi:integrase